MRTAGGTAHLVQGLWAECAVGEREGRQELQRQRERRGSNRNSKERARHQLKRETEVESQDAGLESSFISQKVFITSFVKKSISAQIRQLIFDYE